MAQLTFWFEFGSTYSYLSAMRIEELCRVAGLEVSWRPFLLGPIFRAQGWETSPFNIYEAKGRNMWRDTDRRARELGLPPVLKPDPFPQHSLLASRLALIGLEAGWGQDFVRQTYLRQFADGNSIAAPSDLQPVLEGLGVEASACLEAARTDIRIKDLLRKNTEQALEQGLYGAPSFTTSDGELFWGDDRLEKAIAWTLDQQTHAQG
ncbi:2-hydroxychromene-2-carboxylate isomerase [Roseibium sediminis]|uniref:2-hydroxychromene-2-carboxylate isomerase n=1 Tax=Roseibium sediminis TaxID=1775174 RepID=UPI001FCC4FB5|nr:2-hydroxychromene-2-carboxylate isomerase [Roseibium sediminis]